MKKIFALLSLIICSLGIASAAERFVSFTSENGYVCLTNNDGCVVYDKADYKGVHIAAENLKSDLKKVVQRDNINILIGTLGKSKAIDALAKKGAFKVNELKGKNEKFIVFVLDQNDKALKGIKMDNGKALPSGPVLVIAGSDKRGTIYGVYEVSSQIGVSPWYDWADVAVEKHDAIYVKKGMFTDGEPAVKYRGIFLNDEAPCLTGWVKENYGKYNHQFYARVFELVLRLKGNFMWPAMWDAAFYQDDELNMQTADDMGVMMGTSHHEPMARAHKEWTRVKGRGPWNFDENQAELDSFWRYGVERMKNTEDVVTIGMRGNGDEPMGKNADVALLEKIVADQRQLIEQATGKPAKETPQVWALYKEVQEYYEKGMKVPDDVILLLCDDNWGNVRLLPELGGVHHKGGYGMYYHVDYVGGPRNTKWINVTQIQRMWEQLMLTYDYGVDKLWILNVGDLKPMEFPIDFWFKMAWNPGQFAADNLDKYTLEFCRQQFGDKCAEEAARILNLQCKYVHRRTAEQLSDRTFNLQNGEWERRLGEYTKLEQDATILRELLPVERRTAYDELIYFPVRAMANLYEMYYAVAMNKYYANAKQAQANEWADKVELCFRRDKELCDDYNHRIANGKWNHMMDQVHIGYRSWNDPRENICPKVERVEEPEYEDAPVVNLNPNVPYQIEADAYESKKDAKKATFKYIPDYGIFKGAIALMPYTEGTEGAELTYKYGLTGWDEDEITFYFAPTFPFNAGKGQKVAVSVDGGEEQIVNINEASKYIINGYHDQNYEWETTRVNKQVLKFKVDKDKSEHYIKYRPLDPGVVLERIEVRGPMLFVDPPMPRKIVK